MVFSKKTEAIDGGLYAIAGIFYRYGGKYEENYGSKSGLIARIFYFRLHYPWFLLTQEKRYVFRL